MSEGIPEGWSYPRLGEMFRLNRESIEPREHPNEIFEYFSIPSFDAVGTFELTTGDTIESNKALLSEPTVLVSKLNPRKPRVVLAERASSYRRCASTEFMGYVPSNPDVHLPFYKWYFFSNLFHERLQRVATGSTNSHVRVSPSETLRWNIHFPPKPEQQKIASILTSVDEVIEKTEAQISKLQDLKKGMMQELLTKGIGHTEFKDSPVGRIPKGWDVADLGSLFVFKNGVNKGGEHFGHGVPIISYKNVYNGGGLTLSDITGKVDLTPAEIERFDVHHGDVFFTRTSETAEEIGLSNVYLGERNNVVYNGFVIRARPIKDRLSPEFCKYCFSSESVRQQMIHGSKYTTRAGISSESLAKIRVTVPPLVEQKKIAEAIGSIEASLSAKSRRLAAIRSLKKSLLQDLLTGKVRVKVTSHVAA